MKLLTLVFLLISINLEAQWVNQSVQSSFPLASCHFPDSETGYVVGYGNLILKTTNSGLNWLDISLPTTAENMNSVWFLNADTGFLCSTRDTLLYTTNGGISWLNHFYSVYESQRIYFINGQTGWFTSNGLYKTTNAGMNWNMISNQRAEDFIFINENTGWKTNYLGSGNTDLLKTTDGGISWNVMYNTGNFRVLYCISFINENTGWVCGYRGFVSKTTNGGINWTVQRDVETEALYCIKFLNENTGWAAGDNSIVVRTTDGGNIWTYSNLNASRFQEFCFVDGNTGWLVGSFGKIYRTTNNGGLTDIETGFLNPQGYRLLQNYPNPFNPGTKIVYETGQTDFVSLKIYDILGNEIRTLVSENQIAGKHEAEWNAENFPAGVYFYRLETGNISSTRKMLLVK